jgi:hypothetical protein
MQENMTGRPYFSNATTLKEFVGDINTVEISEMVI